MFRIVQKSGLVISFRVPTYTCEEVASVYLQSYFISSELKFDIVYDNEVPLQTTVVYFKFQKEILVAGWGKWAILLQFCTTSSFAGMNFL